MKNKEICIVGFGRLGKVICRVLDKTFKISVLEIDKNKYPDIIDSGYSLITKEDIKNFDTIIICVPISVFEKSLSSISQYIHSGSLVMDTCSVKVYPVKVMKRLLSKDISIIATHPIFGPDSYNRGLKNLNLILCNVRSDEDTYNKWSNFWSSTGLNVFHKTAQEHDKIMAYTLAMTHFFGRIFKELNLTEQEASNVGYEALYNVMLQTNNDSWQLFYDMQNYNPYTKDMRLKVKKAIEKIDKRLEKHLVNPDSF